jgi:adenylate kinase
VIFLDVPDEEIIKRIAYRRVCLKCGAVYNLIFNPPKENETCNNCGSKLVHREDDREEVVRKRLEVYRDSTEALVKIYEERGVLRRINGLGDREEVFRRIKEAL